MESLMARSRLQIATYNATAHLETLALNVPTIAFWDPRRFELRPSAVPHLQILRAAGIFHDTPESAAAQMARVWDDVAAWWQSPNVQTAREEFCFQYSHMPEKPLEKIGRILHEIAR